MDKSYRWKPWQVEYLIDHFEENTNEEIAEYIERTTEAVAAKMFFLGLKRDKIFLHKIRNTQGGTVKLRKVFNEWDRLFALPKIKDFPKSLSHLING